MKRFIPLLLCAMTMYGGCKLFTINNGKSSTESKQKQKDLCENGVKVMAMLQNEYTEMEIGSSVSYQYKYDYVVDEKTYTGKISKDEELEIPILEVTYDSKNPASVTTVDPCQVYEKIKDNPGRYPQWFEYVGAGLFLLGLSFGQGSLKTLFFGNKS